MIEIVIFFVAFFVVLIRVNSSIIIVLVIGIREPLNCLNSGHRGMKGNALGTRSSGERRGSRGRTEGGFG